MVPDFSTMLIEPPWKLPSRTSNGATFAWNWPMASSGIGERRDGRPSVLRPKLSVIGDAVDREAVVAGVLAGERDGAAAGGVSSRRANGSRRERSRMSRLTVAIVGDLRRAEHGGRTLRHVAGARDARRGHDDFTAGAGGGFGGGQLDRQFEGLRDDRVDVGNRLALIAGRDDRDGVGTARTQAGDAEAAVGIGRGGRARTGGGAGDR